MSLLKGEIKVFNPPKKNMCTDILFVFGVSSI